MYQCLMPSCKAKFCMVTRGMGIRCFAIYLTLQRAQGFAKNYTNDMNKHMLFHTSISLNKKLGLRFAYRN